MMISNCDSPTTSTYIKDQNTDFSKKFVNPFQRSTSQMFTLMCGDQISITVTSIAESTIPELAFSKTQCSIPTFYVVCFSWNALA